MSSENVFVFKPGVQPPTSGLERYAPLLIPLPASVYMLLLPTLSSLDYYGGTFALSAKERPPRVPISVSAYICTIQATGLFVFLNIAPLAYMWLAPLKSDVNHISPSSVSLALFDVFFLLFVITPVIHDVTTHDIFVGGLTGTYFIHLLTLCPNLRSARERILYVGVGVAMVGLTAAAILNAQGDDVGYAFYAFECAAYISAFWLVPILTVARISSGP